MKVSTINWPENTPDKFDITDYINENGVDAFNELINKATPITIDKVHSSHTSHNSTGGKYQYFVPVIDKKRLTPALQDFLIAVTNTTDAPDEFMLASLLVHWAGAVGNKIFIDDPKKKFRPNTWSICFADSSVARKSTALSIGAVPFTIVQNQLEKEYSEEYRDFVSLHDEWESLDVDEKAENPEPLEPHKKRLLLASDFSDAGIYVIMKNNPLSGAIVTGEFGDFFKKLHRDWTGQATALLAAYDNDRMVRITRTHGEEVIEEPTFSILGATTFASFKKIFGATETENGFLARLFPVVVSVPTKKRKPFLQRDMIDNDYSFKLETQIKNWVDFAGEIELTINNKMNKAFTEWEMNFVENAHNKYSETLNPTIERLVPGCLKIAMILQSLEIENPEGMTELELKSNCLECAQMLVENVFLPSMSYLFDNKIVMTLDEMNEEVVLSIIRKSGGTINRSKLRKKSRFPKDVLDDVIKSLSQKYKITISEQKIDRKQSGGSPITFYTLNKD